jgi:hypothetical protein
MINALFPGFLVAGAGLAAAVAGLHLLARRPPARQALPTARFLSEDARTLLRLQPRPTDLVLMLLRMVLVGSLGAAFAGTVWTPERGGRGHVVLLDAGAGAEASWEAAIALAAEAVRGADAGDGATDPIVVAYGLDSGPRVVDVGSLSGLQPGSTRATAEDGLRALRAAVVNDTRWSTVRAEWVLTPTWGSWNAGVGLMRPALWPGSLPLRAVPPGPATARGQATAPDATGPPGGPPPAPTARVEGADVGSLEAALSALGIALATDGSGPPQPGDWLFWAGPSDAEVPMLAARARAGEVVLISGGLGQSVADVPWIPDGSRAGQRAGVVVAGNPRFGEGVVGLGGSPASGAAVVAVFADATPAAAAWARGEGCVVYLAAALGDDALHGSPGYPELVRRLVAGCTVGESPAEPLDPGALASLQRDDLPAVVDVAGLALDEGVPLSRLWILLATLALAAEIALTRRRRQA